MRCAPWESIPRRSASTRLSATMRASSSGTPSAPSSRSRWARSAASGTSTTCSSVSLITSAHERLRRSGRRHACSPAQAPAPAPPVGEAAGVAGPARCSPGYPAHDARSRSGLVDAAREFQVEQADGIAAHDPLDSARLEVAEELLGNLLGVRPGAVLVRIVGFERDVLGADPLEVVQHDA